MNKKYKQFQTGLIALMKPLKVNQFPLQINIEVTTACNLNCKSCLRKYLIDKPEYMSFEQYKLIIDKINPLMLCFVGFGEPMMHPEFFNFVRYAEKKNIHVSVTTNGTLINEKCIENIFNSGINILSISLDAANDEIYSQIRKNNIFNKITSALHNINKKKISKKTLLPNIVFHFVIHNYNYLNIYDFISFSKQYNPAMVYFQPCEYYNNEDKIMLSNIMNRDTLRQEISKANKKAIELKLKTNLFFWEKNFDYLWLKYENNHKELPYSKVACIRPWVSTYISIDGCVYLCCGLSVNSKQSIGNVFKDNFEEIWNAKKTINQRKNIKSGKKSLKGCATCVPLSFYDEYRIFRSKK